ncbi:MAG: LacI family DNA-binding transcriptional regulator [Paenibacillus sp.]|uniref:LacI family DNA-binding transcriptional regulator n=1 Tax=Paenibacillus sp. TaxID=58172 RepID=UPI00290C9557|nr:LacI family DNA-binding transcriptional regulator [Paenibacillus sp.]MDU4694754.1 LacI family DNA-binding transcriptional regulator [Paenibacillus sp.]
MSKKVVMQDIADRLNLSKNSVSQALSGKDGVSEETRRLILETAEAMGYRYAKKPSASRQGSVKTIGLIASDFAFSMKFFGEIYLAVEREAKNHGINLLIQSITPEMKEQLILPSFIKDNQVDGLLILSHISTAYISNVIARGIPTVLIDHHHPLLQADAVLTNNRFSAYIAVKHLLDLGHRDIGILGNVAISPSYQERWEGYMLALREHGIEPREGRILVHTVEEEGIITETMNRVEEQPSAWFCLNDGFAYYVSSALRGLGYKIPDEISVCGFDNSHYSQMASPKITTMEVDLALFAHKAFEQLLWRIDNPDEAYQEILLPTHFIERESTAASTSPSIS